MNHTLHTDQLIGVEAPAGRVPGDLTVARGSTNQTAHAVTIRGKTTNQRGPDQTAGPTHYHVKPGVVGRRDHFRLPYIASTMLLRPTAARLVLALAMVPPGCAAQQQIAPPESSCKVGRVSDGDTFRCTDGRRVRLIGIDSPESQQQPFATSARGALLKLLPLGAVVRLEPDVAQTDRYGRQLAYVWVGCTLVNESMIRDGWAVLYTVPPNVRYAERLRAAQNEARARGTGLWSQRGFECLPKDYRRKRCVNPP